LLAAAYKRIELRDELIEGSTKIPLPDELVYRHPPALSITPSESLIHDIVRTSKDFLALNEKDDVTILDFMAGGGVIPLEAVRYGFRVFANDLNPVAALVLKSTIEYPAKFGTSLAIKIKTYAEEINSKVHVRLEQFFPVEIESEWWNDIDQSSVEYLRTKQVTSLIPCGNAKTLDYLWTRIVPCGKCNLNPC